MTTRPERSEPGATSTDRSHGNRGGTWTIDPADSIVSYAGRTLRLRTITGRLHCLGVIHLDELPPVGIVRFQQPSGLPLLTMALGPASLQMEEADLNATLYGPDVGAVWRQRWWTLDSQSLEILRLAAPGGSWRPSPPIGPRGWSSCAWRSTPRRAAGTGWCCGGGGAGSSGLRHRQVGLKPRPDDPAGVGSPRQTRGTRPSTERHEGHALQTSERDRPGASPSRPRAS